MNIRILSLEKHKDDNLKDLENEFVKRVSKYCKIERENIKRPKIYTYADADTICDEEAAIVLKKIKTTDFVVLLDAGGSMADSMQFAQRIDAWQRQGVQSLVFVIGGPFGISKMLKSKADYTFSLSRLTFTHEMARMLLCEVLYRSFDMLHGGNYHK